MQGSRVAVVALALTLTVPFGAVGCSTFKSIIPGISDVSEKHGNKVFASAYTSLGAAYATTAALHDSGAISTKKARDARKALDTIQGVLDQAFEAKDVLAAKKAEADIDAVSDSLDGGGA